MVKTTHFKGLDEMAEHLKMGVTKLKEILKKCSEDPSLPQFPAYRVENKGPWRSTATELDVWFMAYVETVNARRTPYMRRVSPMP